MGSVKDRVSIPELFYWIYNNYTYLVIEDNLLENFTCEEAEIIFSVMEYIDRISLCEWKEGVVSGKVA